MHMHALEARDYQMVIIQELTGKLGTQLIHPTNSFSLLYGKC